MKTRLQNGVGKCLMLLLLCISFEITSFSQAFIFGKGDAKVEAGFNFGPSFFLGDLGGNRGKGTYFLKDLNLGLTKMMKGAFITFYPNRWFGMRLAADYTYLEGRDNIINTNGINELWRKQRNLDFRTNVIEGYGAIEVFPTLFFYRNSEFEPRLRPYGLVGLGIFHFNPQGSLTDANGNKTWYYLHPLRLEGEGMAEYPYSKPYSLTQMNVPMGAGLKYYFSDRMNVSMEVLYRKTFTDYIDDVSKYYIDPRNFIKYLSAQDAALATKLYDKTDPIIFPGMTQWPAGTQRGDLKRYDAYFSVLFKIGIRLGPIESSSFAKRAIRQTRCPAVY
jgi:hypothetical protein